MCAKFPEKNLEISASNPLLGDYISPDGAGINESESLSFRDPFDSPELKFRYACFALFSQAILGDRKPVPPERSDVPAFGVKALGGPQCAHHTEFQA
jgi:hypothetical protein